MMIQAYWFYAGALLVLAACATPVEKEEEVRAGGGSRTYQTFYVAPLPTHGPSLDPAAFSRLNETARTAIVEGLSAKGYTERAAEEADFIVKVETAFSPDPVFESSERRFVIVGFHDAKTDEVIWSNERGRSSSRTLEPELIEKTIRQMLSTLPGAPFSR